MNGRNIIRDRHTHTHPTDRERQVERERNRPSAGSHAQKSLIPGTVLDQKKEAGTQFRIDMSVAGIQLFEPLPADFHGAH